MRNRLFGALKKYLIIFLIALAYLIFVLLTDIKIPCIIHLISGLQCPGCGITRMALSLIKLDFASAFYYNPYLMTNLPIILFLVIYSEVKYIKFGSHNLGKLNFIIWIELIMALAFGIIRNII